MKLRPAERFGKVMLSAQASHFHYCYPRRDGLPFTEYEEIEIALFPAFCRKSGVHWFQPSDLDPRLAEHDNATDDVLAYRSPNLLPLLRKAARRCRKGRNFNAACRRAKRRESVRAAWRATMLED